MKSLLYLLKVKNQTDRQCAECHPFGRAECTESCCGSWAFPDWVTFLWHRVMSLCLVTGAHTHTLDVFSSQWKVPPWQISPSTKCSHRDPGAVSRHELCSRPPQVLLCSSQTHLVPHWNGCSKRTALFQFSPYLSVISSMLVPNAQ